MVPVDGVEDGQGTGPDSGLGLRIRNGHEGTARPGNEESD